MLKRFLNLFRRRRLDDETRQEMEAHLACIEEEELARGADAASARRNAKLRFGNSVVQREKTRDAEMTMWLDDLWRDLKFASRQLLRNPVFALSAVLLLALGIGVNAAIFTVISSVILRPLPLREPDRLVSILETSGRFDTPASWPDLLDLQNGSHVFEAAGGFRSSTFVFRGGAEALNVNGGIATPGYFPALGVQPIAGRLFDTAEAQDGASPVALIREDFWKSALNADPEVLQKTILVDGHATQVVGILPSGFRFPSSDSVIWMPLIPQGPMRNRGYHAISMVGRLKPSITLALARADLEVVMRRLAREYPEQDGGHHAKVVLFQDWSLDKQLRYRLIVLQVAAFGLFLMAFANVSSLLLARYSARRTEFQIRLALGSSRYRQIRQHLTESLVVTGLGCVAAIAFAAAGVRFLVWLYGDEMPRAAEISPDWRLVGAVILATIGGALALGLGTAFSGSTRKTDRTGVLMRKVLVVFQVTCAVVLLASTGAVLESFWSLLHVDIGFDRSHLITMRVNLPAAKYTTGVEVADRFEQIASHLRSVPGVRSAAAVSLLPVAEWGYNGNVNVEGMQAEHPGFYAEYRWITKDYFRTMGIPLLRGRQFLPEELSGKQAAAIINETMAKVLWGDKDPIGAHIRFSSPAWITVVGIARDVRQSGVTVPASSELYLPSPSVDATPSWSVVVRSDLPAETLLPALRAAVRNDEPEAAIDHVKTMDKVVADSVSAERIVGTLLACFAGLALVLASLGLYSLVTFTVIARLPELAIRSALGSTPAALVGLAGREGLALVLAGLGIGLAAMFPLHGLLSHFVEDAGRLNAPVLGSVLLLMLVAGVSAVVFPALRASRIDPTRILRSE